MQRFALVSLLASLAGLSSAQYPTSVEPPAHISQHLPATVTPIAPALYPVSSYPEAAWTSLVPEISTTPTGYPIASSIPAADATSLTPSSTPTVLYVPTIIATASGYARPSAWGNATTSGLPPMTGAASKGRGAAMGSLGALVGICLAGFVL